MSMATLESHRVRIPLAAIRHQKIGGVESATYNLCRALYDLNVDLRVTLTQRRRLAPEFLAWLNSKQNEVEISQQMAIPASSISTRFFEEIIHTRHERADEHVIYPNYFLPGPRTRALSRSVIIHDCQYRQFPEFFSKKKRRWLDFCYRRALESSDLVFSISHFEKSQLEMYFGDAFSNKVFVIGNAVNLGRLQSEEVRGAHRDWPYILLVAHHFPHKNIGTLIEAFSLVGAKDPEIRLLLVGAPSGEVKTRINSLAPPIRDRVILTGFVSDRELGKLYRGTSLFVLPSLYEGFGMPAIEAMALSVPTLVSDGGALPEVTLGLVPTVATSASAATWAEAIYEELLKPRNAQDLAKISRQIIDQHSSEAVAARVIRALDQVK